VLAVHLTIPVACWRKAYARELLETHELPPPATCYGALLSLVGETDRERHRGVRVTSGVIGSPNRSTVLRTMWRVKKPALPAGTGENAKPDFQQLLVQCDVVIWLDGTEEPGSLKLEDRVSAAFDRSADVTRFGGWSLGESTHLINDAWLRRDGTPPAECRTFVLDPAGVMTLPVWVDHVGTSPTRYAVGTIRSLLAAPQRAQLPMIG
jgi:CRISPR-associated protein Cas5t